jgi:hypothetical protein
MRSRIPIRAALLVVAGLPVAFLPLGAQGNAAHTHIGHVATGFAQAPDGRGLLPTLRAEVETAVQHVALAGRDPSNLQWMQTHAAHVLHALDPAQGSEGPGLGFGAVRAAEGIAQHIELAAGSDGASQNVRTHSAHVAEASRAVAERAREMAELARQVAAARDYTAAEGLIERMARIGGELQMGRDVNGDGQIGWGGGEGGITHVEQHMGFLLAGEGL